MEIFIEGFNEIKGNFLSYIPYYQEMLLLDIL